MANVIIRVGYKSAAWFTANPTVVLEEGQAVFRSSDGKYKIGDGSTALSGLTFYGGVGGTGDALTTNPLSQFASTTSAQLASVISDETGSGALVFGTSPTFTTSITINNVGTSGTPVSIEGLVGTTTLPALYMGVTPNASNYILLTDGFYGILNSPTATAIKAAGTNMVFYSTNPSADGLTAFHEEFAITATAQTAGVARAGFLKAGNVVQWNTGAITLQYENRLTGGTYSFVGASTITTSATLEVSAATASTNCTITNNYSGRFTGGHGVQITAGTIAGQGIVIREGVSLATEMCIYAGVTPSSTNYCFRALSNYTHVNYGTIGSLTISASGNARVVFDDTNGISISSKGINTTAGDSATINSIVGRFRKDTTGTTFTLTNSFITANSIITLTQADAALDATATAWTVSAAAGSATITFNAAPTANLNMNFHVLN